MSQALARNGRRARVTLGAKGLTPLLDTLFLLLFTLLATSQPTRSEALEMVHIQLPEVEPEFDPGASAEERLVLEIDADSQIRVAEGAAVESVEALDAALQEALGGRAPEETPVQIHGDRAARHGVAVQLLQHLRLRGFVAIELIAEGIDGDTGFVPSLRGGELR